VEGGRVYEVAGVEFLSWFMLVSRWFAVFIEVFVGSSNLGSAQPWFMLVYL
jgi:hypothetical protein